MKKLVIEYTTGLEFSGPVFSHKFLLRCLPQENSQQRMEGLTLELSPDCVHNTEVDGFGNVVVVGTCMQPHDHFSWTVRATAYVDQAKRASMPYKPLYKYPSRLCTPGPCIEALVEEARKGLKNNPRVQSPLEKASYLMNLVYERFQYVPGVTTVRTTAEEALTGGRGVCQDYAHILIACCRKLGVMARYVAGLMVGEGASHAWVEVYQAGTWWSLDPTHNRCADDTFVKIAHGRDYGDCKLDIGAFHGDFVQQTQTVVAKVTEA